MTSIIPIALIALLSSPLMATDAMDAFCSSQGKLASTIMQGRQNGVPIDKALAIAATAKAPADDLTRGLVLDAYDHPRWTTPAIREQTIREFANQVTLTCIKAVQALREEGGQP